MELILISGGCLLPPWGQGHWFWWLSAWQIWAPRSEKTAKFSLQLCLFICRANVTILAEHILTVVLLHKVVFISNGTPLILTKLSILKTISSLMEEAESESWHPWPKLLLPAFLYLGQWFTWRPAPLPPTCLPPPSDPLDKNFVAEFNLRPIITSHFQYLKIPILSDF